MSASYLTLELLQRLTDIGISLSTERNHERLLEKIVIEGQTIANADGGTLYLLQDDDMLDVHIIRTLSRQFFRGGTTGAPPGFPKIYMHDPETGKANYGTQAVFAIMTGRPVNLPDVYDADGFDFSDTKRFDKVNNYHTKSVLTIPMRDHQGDVIGALQFVNAMNEKDEIIAFSTEMQNILMSLASQAAVAITNRRLIEGQKELLEAFIHVIAEAIDQKSPYTGTHCSRVPLLTEMLAEAACEVKEGKFKDFNLTEEEKYELHIAGWLHDCGKIVTPMHVMDKSTKLETIFDRINLVHSRIEILKRDAELAHLRGETAKEEYDAICKGLDDDFAFLQKTNIGGEFMEDAALQRLNSIARRSFLLNGKPHALLSDEELYNLSLRRGTLTPEERKIINDHMTHTVAMLERLPFPKHLQRVPEYACGHHEKMDGTGYPKGLKGHEMSLPARMMAIADIFEALTASDRPYKPAKKLSEAMRIMGNMKRDNHLDPDLFDLFVTSGVYRKYANQFLTNDLIDQVNEAELLGITPKVIIPKLSA